MRREDKIMNIRVLLVGLLVVGGSLGAGWADTYEIPPSHDSYVNNAAPSGNGGSAPYLKIGDVFMNNPAHICRTYLQFNLWDYISSADEVTSATVYLYVTGEGPDPAIQIGSHFMSDDNWTETSISWNNQPGQGNAPAATDTKGVTWHWTWWDVTSLVQAEAGPSGDGTLSLLMKETTEGIDNNWALFTSKEETSPGVGTPYLEVVTEPSSAAPDGETLASWANVKAFYR
jgi:hypothetical protein